MAQLPIGIPNWISAPDVWDQAILGGTTLPGMSKVTISKEQKIDEKSAPGVHGATLTYQGYKSAVVTIVNTIWDVIDLDTLVNAIQAVEPVPSKKLPSPVDLLHPMATIRNVKSVIVQKIDGPNQTAPGRWETTFSCLEYFPPKGGATTTPQSSLQPRQTPLSQPTFPDPPSKTPPTL